MQPPISVSKMLNSFNPKFLKDIRVWLGVALMASVVLAGCNDSDDVDPAIRDSANKQREAMGSRPNNPALQPGQPGAPPAGTNPAGTDGGATRPR